MDNNGIMATVLDRSLDMSSNSSHVITFIFELIPLGKLLILLSSQLGIK